MVERARIDPASVKLLEDQVSVAQLPNGVSFVRVPYTFTTSNPAATCSIAFKLVRMSDTGDLKVFTVTSALKEVHAKPWGPMKTAPTADLSESSTEPSLPDSVEVLVIGAGHGGLAISAYLKALGIVHALVDKEPTIGDAWGKVSCPSSSRCDGAISRGRVSDCTTRYWPSLLRDTTARLFTQRACSVDFLSSPSLPTIPFMCQLP